MNQKPNPEAGRFTLEPSLPSAAYVTEESFRRERDRIFLREWICAARAEDVPAPGGHAVIDVMGESILLVRNREGLLKAHYNVCRHRGARLCAAEGEKDWGFAPTGGVTGNGLIRCPYHQWSYDLDGRLVAAPLMGEAGGFDRSGFSLYPVGVAEWGGFVFLHLAPEAEGGAPPIAAQLGEAPRRLANYPLDRLVTARTITYDVAANWKVILENYNECYHCPGVHPELCEVVPEFRVDGGIHLDWELGVPHREGAWTYTASGTTSRAPFPGLSEEEKVRHKGELLYPNLMLSVSADHVAAFVLKPLAHDRTEIACRFLFHPEEMAKPGFDPADAVDFWHLVNRQDWFVCERVQAGMSSRPHTRGFYAPIEDYSVDIRRYYERLMG